MQIDLTLLKAQADFVTDIETPNLALIGGFGAGKTRAAAAKLLYLASLNTGHGGIALSPTYGMAARVLIPEMEGMFSAALGTKNVSFNKSLLYFDLTFARGEVTRIYVLAAESYRRVLGLSSAFFLIDEVDTIQRDLAAAAWQACISRLRKGNVFQACATTTPEGLDGFTYQYWHQDIEANPELAKSRKIIRARTLDNPYLPAEYIEKLREAYPPKLLEAYLNGFWVNIKGNVVYPEYDLERNKTDLTLRDIQDRPLHCGIDFNNNGMSLVTGIILDNAYHVVDESFGAKNTSALIDIMKIRYGKHKVYIYPDPASRANHTSASQSDLVQLQRAGYETREMNSHPTIRDRVNSVNAQLAHKRLFVNPKTAPYLHHCMMSQPYTKDGVPLKDNKIDGPVDALGYLIYKNWPLKRPTVFGSIIT